MRHDFYKTNVLAHTIYHELQDAIYDLKQNLEIRHNLGEKEKPLLQDEVFDHLIGENEYEGISQDRAAQMLNGLDIEDLTEEVTEHYKNLYLEHLDNTDLPHIYNYTKRFIKRAVLEQVLNHNYKYFSYDFDNLALEVLEVFERIVDGADFNRLVSASIY